MRFVFATQNPNKIREIKPLLPASINLLLPQDIGFEREIPETGETLEENAEMKARFIFEKYQIPAFSDDTGLEVAALGGKPSVYSARFAGEEKNAEKNIEKLLAEMKGKDDRSAYFRTVIALVFDSNTVLFEGKILGKIAYDKIGTNGFGYDPVSFPPEVLLRSHR